MAGFLDQTVAAGASSAAVQIFEGRDLSISGTANDEATIERYIGGAWRAVETVTVPTERVIDATQNGLSYRVSAASGNSGSVRVLIL